jgi:hypothetical protein
VPVELHCVVIDSAPGRNPSPDCSAPSASVFDPDFVPDFVLFIAVVKPDSTVLMAFWIEVLGGVTGAGVVVVVAVVGDVCVGLVGLADPPQAMVSAIEQRVTSA